MEGKKKKKSFLAARDLCLPAAKMMTKIFHNFIIFKIMEVFYLKKS